MPRQTGPWLLAAAISLAIVAAVLMPVGRQAEIAHEGEPAPDFSLPPLDGGAPVSLSSLRGRVVLLNFWATWCVPCESEMPAMERLHRALAGQPFELLAVSVDERAEDVRAFRDRLGLTFPILQTEGGSEAKAVAQRWGTFRYPESWLVDREGRVVARYVGARDWDAEAYLDRIRRLLQP